MTFLSLSHRLALLPLAEGVPQASVAEACAAAEATCGPGCRMGVGFEPLSMDKRVVPRQRP